MNAHDAWPALAVALMQSGRLGAWDQADLDVMLMHAGSPNSTVESLEMLVWVDRCRRDPSIENIRAMNEAVGRLADAAGMRPVEKP